jgi:transcriptional regulator with XRE-family HTH domain
MVAFAERLRKTREEAKMLQKDLANKAGLSQRIISKYERGESYPRGASLHKLADALETPVSYLTDEVVSDLRQDAGKDPFAEEGRAQYGQRPGLGAKELLDGTMALFAGGSLDEDNLELFYEAVTRAYLEAKSAARNTFGRRRSR